MHMSVKKIIIGIAVVGVCCIGYVGYTKIIAKTQSSEALKTMHIQVNEAAAFAAVQTKNSNTLSLLLKAGINPDAISKVPIYGTVKDMSLLQLAAFEGDLPCVTVLYENGAHVDLQNSNGGTAIMAACWQGGLDVIKYLVSKGADIDKTTKMGGTALMGAAVTGKSEVVKFLLANGANPNHEDNNKNNAWSIAQNPEIKSILAPVTKNKDASRISPLGMQPMPKVGGPMPQNLMHAPLPGVRNVDAMQGPQMMHIPVNTPNLQAKPTNK
jgi:Ankyrin repeats (3 copies)